MPVRSFVIVLDPSAEGFSGRASDGEWLLSSVDGGDGAPAASGAKMLPQGRSGSADLGEMAAFEAAVANGAIDFRGDADAGGDALMVSVALGSQTFKGGGEVSEVGLLGSAGGAAQALVGFDWNSASQLHASYQGIQVARLTLSSPRKQLVTCLRIDLKAPGIELLTTSRASGWIDNSAETISQTTRQFIGSGRGNGLQVACAINADAFSAISYSRSVSTNLRGLNVSNGMVVSSANKDGNAATLVVDSVTGAQMVVTGGGGVVPSPVTTSLAVSGFGFLLSSDLITAPQEQTSLAARSAVGLSADRRYLLMMTIDNNKRLSQGSTLYETAQHLQWFGASDGINLDGGGSTQLAWWDPSAQRASLLNNPGGERYVGNSLGVYVASA